MHGLTRLAVAGVLCCGAAGYGVVSQYEASVGAERAAPVALAPAAPRPLPAVARDLAPSARQIRADSAVVPVAFLLANDWTVNVASHQNGVVEGTTIRTKTGGRNGGNLTIGGTFNQTDLGENANILLFLKDSQIKLVPAEPAAATTLNFTLPELADGLHDITLVARNAAGADVSTFRFKIQVRSTPLAVVSVDGTNLQFETGPYQIRVMFNTGDLDHAKTTPKSLKELIKLYKNKSSTPLEYEKIDFDEQIRSAILTLNSLDPGIYEVQVTGGPGGILDAFKNQLRTNGTAPDNSTPVFKRSIIKPVGIETPQVRPGIKGATGPYVDYPEYTRPRQYPNGFNPSDKVESRVARLYYYRDAHRVAQIINRNVQSYNRAGVDMQQQLADKARHKAEQSTTRRQQAERAAVQAAQETRRIENELAAKQQQLDEALRHLQAASAQKNSENGADTIEESVITNLESVTRTLASQIRALEGQVEEKRQKELSDKEQWQRMEREEQLARTEQFQREAAAGKEDPDTYAPGVPESDDPVKQVSVSVIGEGLLHLRGPVKGINVIRLMINQIDAPVGQVRIGVHTVQINGEHGDRMEKIANKIQKYIDHSRFLTAQSAEMLRKSIYEVAALRAEEARSLFPGDSQEARDRRYLYAFFGRDFTDELLNINSEFLNTGNKLLSLNSMDTTSQASSLFVFALAKNETRRQILARFEELMLGELPLVEQHYFESGQVLTKLPRLHHEKFQLLSSNAKFQSLRGFFDAEIVGDDTLTPIQREFIRLAQIFKARLVTELEYKQRVRERALVEQRFGDREQELRDAKNKELRAAQLLDRVLSEIREPRRQAAVALAKIRSRAVEVASLSDRYAVEGKQTAEVLESSVYPELEPLMQGRALKTIEDSEKRAALQEIYTEGREQLLRPSLEADRGEWEDFAKRFSRYYEKMFAKIKDLGLLNEEGGFEKKESFTIPIRLTLPNDKQVNIEFQLDEEMWLVNVKNPQELVKYIHARLSSLDEARRWIEDNLRLEANERRLLSDVEALLKQTESRKSESNHAIDNLQRLILAAEKLVEITTHVNDVLCGLTTRMNSIVVALGNLDKIDSTAILSDWYQVVNAIRRYVKGKLLTDNETLLKETEKAFGVLGEKLIELRFLRDEAKTARQRLDYKKLLDMLVDDLEDKYIELLDGTRAHTANIDNYIKRVITALDDDFNTQFYNPAFRLVRQSSQLWDVQLGQVETTTILANNRGFAKVSPSATMEFDLPERDIALIEGLNAGKALVDEFGALVNDPSFLALGQLSAGQSTANTFQNGSVLPTVRSVLPGLDSQSAEQVIAHSSTGRPDIKSPLENLIPDPAIYKFETGTGFEIRPVIQPDGQAVVFDFNYMYTTNVREPVRADEKHLGRVKRHFIDTDVQLSNFELREVSRYVVALKASRTGRGVPLLEDIPLVGILFRPLPQQESSLQENVVMAQATIFPTLFDLMGLRWAPAVSNLDPLRLSNEEFLVRGRFRSLENWVWDVSGDRVDGFLQIPEAQRRADLYRSQETIPSIHPNGYQGPGLDLRDSHMQEGFQPDRAYPERRFIPGASAEGAPFHPGRQRNQLPPGTYIERYPVDVLDQPMKDAPEPAQTPDLLPPQPLPRPPQPGTQTSWQVTPPAGQPQTVPVGSRSRVTSPRYAPQRHAPQRLARQGGFSRPSVTTRRQQVFGATPARPYRQPTPPAQPGYRPNPQPARAPAAGRTRPAPNVRRAPSRYDVFDASPSGTQVR